MKIAKGLENTIFSGFTTQLVKVPGPNLFLSNFQIGLCPLAQCRCLDCLKASCSLIQTLCHFLGNGKFWKVDHFPSLVGTV